MQVNFHKCKYTHTYTDVHTHAWLHMSNFYLEVCVCVRVCDVADGIAENSKNKKHIAMTIKIPTTTTV